MSRLSFRFCFVEKKKSNYSLVLQDNKILSKIFTKTDNLRNLFSSMKLFVCLFVSSFLHKTNQTLEADLTETIYITLSLIKFEDLRCSRVCSRSWLRKCSFKITFCSHILNLQQHIINHIFVQKSLI
jgi:hypothetical protein